jgi:hypothetical protein
MFSPNVLCYIQLLQSNEQRLTAIPVMIFGIGVERNDDVFRMVDVGKALYG